MSRLDDLTPGQAHYVLGRIVSDKKIRSREIDKYLREMDQEIKELEQRLSLLKDAQAADETSSAPSAPAKRRSRRSRKSSGKGTAGKSKGAGKKRGSRKATTPEAQKSRQLQGKYISLIKRFSGKERDKYKKIASEQGREEAVKRMQAAIG